MFTMLVVVVIFAALLAIVCTALIFLADAEWRRTAAVGAVVLWGLAAGVLLWAFNTGGGELAWRQFFASSKAGHWLVVDNSGGKTLRHWVLENGYAEPHEGGAGWQFYDANGNLCYVGGDAYVMQILQPLDQFRKDFKRKYNIPEEQESLR